MNYFLNNLPHEQHKDTSDICSFRTVPYMYSCRLQEVTAVSWITKCFWQAINLFIHANTFYTHWHSTEGWSSASPQMRVVLSVWYMWTPLGLGRQKKGEEGAEDRPKTPRREGFSWPSQNRIWRKAHFEPHKQLMSPHHVTACWRTEGAFSSNSGINLHTETSPLKVWWFMLEITGQIYNKIRAATI